MSKAFVEIAGKPMVVHVLEALLHTPEVSEVYLVGNPTRLAATIAEYGCLALAAARGCPIHVVPQRETLYANVWNTFLRAHVPGPAVVLSPLLPRKGSEGDLALRAAGPSAFFDAIDLRSADARARLAAYGAGGHDGAPAIGFWSAQDLAAPLG